MATREDRVSRSRPIRSAEHVQVPIQVPNGDETDIDSEVNVDHNTYEEDEKEEEEEEEEQHSISRNPRRRYGNLYIPPVAQTLGYPLSGGKTRAGKHFPPTTAPSLVVGHHDSIPRYPPSTRLLRLSTFGPLLHSALLPPLTLSAPDDSTSEDEGSNGAFVDPFTLYHLGHRILGYGTVRLHIYRPALDIAYSLDSTHRHDYRTVLKNVLYVPTAPERRISFARLVNWPSNETDGEARPQVVTIPPDGTLDFWRPRIHTIIHNGRYLIRAWA